MPTHPDRAALRAALAAGLVATLLTFLSALLAPVVARLVVPADAVELTATLRAELLGLSLVVTSPARVLAGVLAAVVLRRRRGSDRRREALPAALAGVGAAWALFAVAAVWLAAVLGQDLQPVLVGQLLELPRWLLEASVGAFLVPPGSAARAPLRGLVCGAPVRDDDRGAATVEYSGAVLVAVAVVMALLAAATGIGQHVVARICAALELSCAAPTDRAAGLGIVCVQRRDDRSDAVNASFELARLDRKDTDQLSVHSDGSAQVVLTQSTGAGVDATTGKVEFEGTKVPDRTVKGEAKAGVRVQAYGETGYVYSFPQEYGGEAAAQEFLGSRRGVLGTAGDLLNRNQQTMNELAVRAASGVVGLWQDLTGASPQERAAAQRVLGQQTADAVQFAVGVKADAEAGSSVPVADAKAAATADGRGTVTVSLHDGGPDHVGSSFEGKASGDLAGQLSWNPAAGDVQTPLSGTGKLKGSGSVSYKVSYDGAGDPTKVVFTTEAGWTGELTGGGKGTVTPKGLGSTSVKGATGGGHGGVTMTSMTLDLTDPANRAAFDGVFGTAGGETLGRRYGVSVPTSPSPQAWATLGQRLRSDAYLAAFEYANTSGGDDGVALSAEVKAAGTGAGTEWTAGSRSLVAATGRDLRTGEAAHPLVTCG